MALDKKQRDHLKSWQSLLQKLATELPVKAKGFHRLRNNLENKLTGDLNTYYVSSATVEARKSNYDQVVQLGRGLRDLMTEGLALEGDLDKLRDLFAKERSSIDYANNFYEQQTQVIASLWSCEKLVQLQNIQQQLSAVKNKIDLHSEALRVFQAADKLIGQINSDMQSAALKIALQEQRALLLEANLNPIGIKQLKELCEPLKRVMDQPAPEGLAGLADQQREIRQWDTLLGLSNQEERDLDRKVREQGDFRMRQDMQALENLTMDAKMLLHSRRMQASNLRSQELSKLQSELAELIAVCGYDSDFECTEIKNNLDALASRRVETDNHHKEWMGVFRKEQGNLDAMVGHYAEQLEKRVKTYCKQAQEPLNRLQLIPLTAALRKGVKDFQIKLDRLVDESDPKRLLGTCQQAKNLPFEIQQLEAQANDEVSKLDQEKQQLLDDYLSFESQAAQSGFTYQEMRSAIDALNSRADFDSESLDLDDALALTTQLRQQLDRQLDGFKGYCQTELGRITDDLISQQTNLSKANEALGKPLTDITGQINAIVNGQLPYLDSLNQLNSLALNLEAQLQPLLTELAQTLDQQRHELQLRSNGALHPEQQQEIDALLNQLEDHATQYSPAEQQILPLVELMRSIKQYWFMQQADERTRKAHLEACKTRLKALKANSLDSCFTIEQANRLTDLIYGLPEQPSPMHQAQLNEIERLLRFFETLTQRKMAEHTTKQIMALADGTHRHHDSSAVTDLLGRIQAHGHNQPLPENLRKELASAVALVS